MPHFNFKTLRSMKDVPASEWDALEPRNVLTSHLWLSALEDSGLVGPGQPVDYCIPSLTDAAGQVLAAAPGMLRRSTVETSVRRTCGSVAHRAAVGDDLWLFCIFCGDRFLSGSYAIQSGDTLYGGHWGELEFVPNAVFEVGLYRMLEIAIELGLKRVDQGGWAPHKPKRGFMPVRMPNAHWIRDPGVRADAVKLAAEHRRVFEAYKTPTWAQRYLRKASSSGSASWQPSPRVAPGPRHP